MTMSICFFVVFFRFIIENDLSSKQLVKATVKSICKRVSTIRTARFGRRYQQRHLSTFYLDASIQKTVRTETILLRDYRHGNPVHLFD